MFSDDISIFFRWRLDGSGCIVYHILPACPFLGGMNLLDTIYTLNRSHLLHH